MQFYTQSNQMLDWQDTARIDHTNKIISVEEFPTAICPGCGASINTALQYMKGAITCRDCGYWVTYL